MRIGKTFITYGQRQQILKPTTCESRYVKLAYLDISTFSNLKSLLEKKTIRRKQNKQTELMSPLPEGRELNHESSNGFYNVTSTRGKIIKP